MLFDPGMLARHPWSLLATLGIILIGKSAAAFLLVRVFRNPFSTALTISASLAQIGEFSFILSGLGVTYGLLPKEGRDLVLAGAIISILLNPFLFVLAEWVSERRERKAGRVAEPIPPPEPETDLVPTALAGHVILVGYGTVGTLVAARIIGAGRPLLVIEDRPAAVEAARQAGAEVLVGNAAEPRVLDAANLTQAHILLIAIPEGFEAGQIAEQARTANPTLRIIAHAHSQEETDHMARHGADITIMGEREVAHRMLDHALTGETERTTLAPDADQAVPA
jgi:CPA2 family monovalent cation:H+ antiporter-2